MQNRAFWRAIQSLAHPISIGAVILLLLNDHYLRHTSPSWLTGKLGDFSWLIFAPFICAAVISWLVPHHLPQQEKWVAGISFAFIGLWFATAKTIPFIHEITLDLLEKIIGWRGTLRLDVTDLLTLPALLIGWYIWRNTPNMPLKLAPRAWVILALGLVGTLATSYVEESLDRGISCIFQDGDTLKAVAATPTFPPDAPQYYYIPNYPLAVFESNDGGFSWEQTKVFHPMFINEGVENFTCPTPSELITDPSNPQIQYRFIADEAIEKSTDNGRTWDVIYALDEPRQQVRIYYHREKGYCDVDTEICSYFALEPTPSDMFYDVNTGNLIFAMGWNGVLIHTPNGNWQWVGMGRYYLENLGEWEYLWRLLYPQTLVAMLYGLLLFTTIIAYSQKIDRSWLIPLILSGLCWLCGASFWSYVISESYYGINKDYDGDTIILNSYCVVPAIAMFLIYLWFDILYVVVVVKEDVRKWKPVGMVFLFSIISCFLYLMPYILWSYGRISRYRAAMLFSGIIVLGTLFAAYTILQRLKTTPQPPASTVPSVLLE